jgi:pyruvate-formate lyase
MPISTRTQSLCDFSRGAGRFRGYQDAVRREVLWLRAYLATPEGLPHVERCAHAFAGMLREIPLVLEPDDLLAGLASPGTGGEERAALEVERDLLRARLAVPVFAFSADVQAMFAAITAIHGKTPHMGGVGQGHTNVNYARVLRAGLAAMAGDADAAARAHQDPERAAACRAMAVTLRGAMAFAERHAVLADALALEASPARAAELRRIARSLRRCPSGPAGTFFEAVQAVWLVFLVLGMSESPSANSLGCADRYLYPYFAADLATGRLEAAQAEELIAHFLTKIACSSEGQALTLGGTHPDGTDATNDVTRLFLRLLPELKLLEPIVAVRVHDRLEETDLDAMLAYAAVGTGNPSFYAEARCRAMLRGRGIPEADQAYLALNSCMGVIVSGAEVSDMWGGIVLLPLALELAVSRGYAGDGTVLPVFADLCPAHYASLEELYAAYLRIAEVLTGFVVEKNRQHAAYLARWQPNPYLSALLDDCRLRGLDRLAGGPRYHSTIIEGFGWANVSDSLLAIDELVYRRGVVELDAWLTAVRMDYQGQEQLLQVVRACPKYGNGDAAADAWAVRVLEDFVRSVNAQRQPGEFQEFLPSLHTLHTHVHRGMDAPVSFDGRRHGAPLNKQVGPSAWAVTEGPTGVLQSAAKVPTDALPGGQALDLSLPASVCASPAGQAQVKALIQTYFALGGADLQLNFVDPATLRAAQAHPEAYPELLVRIAGYSERFIRLDRATQDDFIARVECGV